MEIKRMNYHLTDEEYNRAINYLYALDSFLNDNPRVGTQFPRRRLTFIVDHIDKLRPASLSSLDSDARIDRRTWRELLDSTRRAPRLPRAGLHDARRGGRPPVERSPGRLSIEPRLHIAAPVAEDGRLRRLLALSTVHLSERICR
ncbi:hypothetical protein [Nocardia sp. R6R-6]|uniref:hypothetical protein n=1 Tax=Nocardia sp. R6R-6 TaxID=3459303 RepID=UPI00403D73E8